MTRNEIEKALELCELGSFEECNRCPIEQIYKDDCRCGSVLAKRALAYITRLKAENEKLTKEADENAALAMEQKLRADKLQAEKEAEIKRQEKFAKENGFTMDCSPYYVATEYKKRIGKLEAQLQANLEKAYEHNTEECAACMNKVDFKKEQEFEVLKEQIRKETAERIYEFAQDFFEWDEEGFCGSLADVLKQEYGAEVKE